MKTKVLHLTTGAKMAGAENLLVSVADRYDRKNFEYLFCTLSKKGSLHDRLQQYDVKAYSLDIKGIFDFPGALIKLVFLLRKENVEIIHTHLLHACIFGQIAACISGVKYRLMTRHYTDYLHLFGNSRQRYMDRLSTSIATKIIAVSHAAKTVMSTREGVNSDKIVVVHNGFDEKRISFFNINPTEDGFKHVVSIASLEPRKGHRFFIEAASEIALVKPDVRFLIVGDGAIGEDLKHMVETLNLSSKIKFLGYREEIFDILRYADIFVQPSVEEGFGISILEAMAMGKPIVASRVGGIPEIIKDGVCGFLVPPADKYALAQAIIRLLDDESLIRKMGHKAKAIVKDYFSIEKMVRSYEDIYRHMINNIERK